MEEKKEEVVEEKEPAPEKLIEVIGKPAMSQAELKKLAELKRLKREQKKKAKEAKADDGPALPKMAAAELPPVMQQRKGGFDLVPDFLQKKELARDLTNLQEKDMLAEALKKQEESMKDQFAGMSMAEIAAAKRK